VEQLESKITELEKRIKEQEKQERPLIFEPQEEAKTEYFFH